MFVKDGIRIGIVVLGGALAACSSMKEKPAAPVTASESPAVTPAELNSEPDLEKMAKERAARGETARKEDAPKAGTTIAGADTSGGALVPVPADLEVRKLATEQAADYTQALALMKAGRLDESYALFDYILSRTDSLSGPLLNQAIIRMRQSKYADATLLLKKAQTINSKNPYAFSLMGYAEKQQGHFKAAREAYEQALALAPKYGKAQFNLAVLADLYLQDLPLALEHYQAYQALQAKPDPTVAKWIIDLQKRTGVYKAPEKARSEEITEDTPPPAPQTGDQAATPAPSGDATPATPATPEAQPAQAQTVTPAAKPKGSRKAHAKAAAQPPATATATSAPEPSATTAPQGTQP